MSKRSEKILRPWKPALLQAMAIWLVCGGFLSFALGRWNVGAVGYFLVFAGLSFLDLWVLGMAVGAVFRWMETDEADSEKRAALAIQAFVWGLFKLACLGILGWILILLKDSPAASLALGLGTLVIVSLLGGWIWSQRVVRHA